MAEHQKWEHLWQLAVDDDPMALREQLNGLGEEGWQLCAINSPCYWFKRPILTQEKQD